MGQETVPHCCEVLQALEFFGTKTQTDFYFTLCFLWITRFVVGVDQRFQFVDFLKCDQNSFQQFCQPQWEGRGRNLTR